MKSKIFALCTILACLFSGCGKPDSVIHEDLPPDQHRVFLFVYSGDSEQVVPGAEITLYDAKGHAITKHYTIPGQPVDFLGSKSDSTDFTINECTIEIKKEGYKDYKMKFIDVQKKEVAKNSFEVYAKLEKL